MKRGWSHPQVTRHFCHTIVGTIRLEDPLAHSLEFCNKEQQRQGMESTTAEASSPTTLMRPDRKVIFINLIIVDASDAIDQKLSKKFKGVPAPLAAVAKSVAKTLATPDHIASVLAQEM